MTKDGSALSNFKDVLQKQGLKAGLEFLNERVPHRFTSVYRLEGDMLNRVAFVDKQGSSGHELAHAPFKESLCEVAVQAGGLVVASDVSTDPRFEGLPNPGKFASYVGVPLATPGGELFGTLCHSDTCRHPLSDAEFQFLNEVAKVLAAYLEQVYPPGGKRVSQ